VPSADLRQEMLEASAPSLGFFFMLGLASAIATFGLIADSAPTIIGAMIIAPLMAPIMSLSFGLVTLDRRLMITSLPALIAGTVWTVAIAFAATSLLGIRVAGPEILSRTSPTLLDLGVALAAGGAAAFAHARRGIANSIAGVAIAVALVPPLAVSGIGLAIGSKAVSDTGISLSEFERWSGAPAIATESFLLFLTNLVGIVVVSVLVFAALRYGRWKHVLAALPIVLAFAAFEIRPLNMALHEVWVKNRALRLAVKLTESRPDLISGREKINSIGVFFRDDVLHVSIEAFIPRDLLSSEEQRAQRVDRIQQVLSEDVGEPVVLEIDLIPVDVVRLRSAPPELPSEQ
jgi:uncharacterized hydrophobic protein (TIGR00271 family)